MKFNEENDEIIQFCLKHDLIKKTVNGYVVKKNFFELLDYYYLKGGEKYYGSLWATKKIDIMFPKSSSKNKSTG